MTATLKALTMLNLIIKAKGMLPYELEPIVWNYQNYGISLKEFTQSLTKYAYANKITIH